jgi:Ca-activated chloride channel homolog
MIPSNSGKKVILILGFILAMAIGSISGAGHSAEDYIHGGASKYIQGRLQEASIEVEEGLHQFPRDSKLKALAEQLKKMKDQKKKDQGGSGSKSGENPKDKEDKKDSTGKGDKDKQEKDKQEKEQQEKQDQEKPDADKNPKDSSGKAPAPAKPGELTKEEAERLLNSYQDDEKREHQQMQQKQRRPVDTEMDW